MKLTFHGGAMSVTGANYLLEVAGKKILVDCGLAQGSGFAETLTSAPFSYPASTVDVILITHGHADHFARLPKLYKDGFRGKIFTTVGTRDLMAKAFPDSYSHLAEEAVAENHPPLYSPEDIAATMELVTGVKYYEPIELVAGVTATFHNAGHILGSAIVEVISNKPEAKGKILFSGDLGNSGSLLMPEKDFPTGADYLVLESAYGGRTHEGKLEREAKFLETLMHVVGHKGTLMIPAFAIERAQEVLFLINKLVENKIIPVMPVFFDSPLAIEMTKVYEQHRSEFNQTARDLFAAGDDIFKFPGLKLTSKVEESKKINDIPGPKVIIAGSGMSNGGRILHHERRYLSDPNSAIIFVGYQVEGSLGRKILDGHPTVKIFGEEVPVRCIVKAIGGFSGHADQPQLVEWVERVKSANLKKVFLVQGEASSAMALAEAIKAKVAVETAVPQQDESFEL